VPEGRLGLMPALATVLVLGAVAPLTRQVPFDCLLALVALAVALAAVAECFARLAWPTTVGVSPLGMRVSDVLGQDDVSIGWEGICWQSARRSALRVVTTEGDFLIPRAARGAAAVISLLECYAPAADGGAGEEPSTPTWRGID